MNFIKAQEFEKKLNSSIEKDKKRLEFRMAYYWETGEYRKYKKIKAELKKLKEIESL